jgi:methionyl-tRNA formyltransferase
LNYSNLNKIIFCGSDAIALPMLNYLSRLNGVSVLGVLSQPDRRSGRGRKLQPNPIKEWALESGVEVQTPIKPSTQENEWIKERDVDLVLVMAYGHILSQEFLDSAKFGCYNLHASLLPSYRGASPIETSLACGEKETGVTLMRMVRQMDAGPIIDQESVPITVDDTGASLRNKLAKACVPVIDRNLNELLCGEGKEREQDPNRITYCRKLVKDDSYFDFSLTAEELEWRSRAFRAWPGSVFFYEDIPLRVGECKISDPKQLKPGELIIENSKLMLGTGEGTLEILQLQKPGGKMLVVSDFLRGFSIKQPCQIAFPSNSPLVSKKFH